MAAKEKIIQCWDNFIKSIKKDLDPDEIEAWVSNLSLVHFDDANIAVGGVNQFFCNWIRDHHQKLVKKKLIESFEVLGLKREFDLVIQVEKKQNNSNSTPDQKPKPHQEDISDGLNPAFVFETFVNGGNSDIAYAAARAVGDNIEEKKYNPLFICGDVGLGKTHLVQGIGLRAKELNDQMKVRYCSSKEFTNEVINGIRFGKIQEVRNRFRKVDLFIIDDIQFLEGKESTQEEFFHTFNELIQNKKQIVLTADRYPREIRGLEERLVNRFNSGMVARIYPPDYETRVAIIRAKVAKMELPLSEEITTYIANSVKTNVRDIEGILIHLEANWSLLEQEIDMGMVKRILKEVLNVEDAPKTVDAIIKSVSNKFNVKISDIKSDRRDKEISKSRQIAMFISREVTELSYPVIGKHFGGKNHTTVLQACKKTKEWMERDPEIKQTINSIIRELAS